MRRPRTWIFFGIVLALAAGCARLGLGFEPLGPSKYSVPDAIILAGLAAWPVLALAILIVRIVRGSNEFIRTAVKGLGLEVLGPTDASGTLAGVAMQLTTIIRKLPNGKQGLRWAVVAKRPEGRKDSKEEE